MRFLLAAAVALGCAEEPSPRDPCARASCSGHGTCVASGPNARCECQTGYAARGLACLATVDAGSDASPCDGDAGAGSVAWTIETIMASEGQSQVPSMTIGPADSVHAAFHDANQGFVHASDETGEWVVETPGPSDGGDGIAPSIAIEPDGSPHAAFESLHRIVHLFRRDGRWILGGVIDPLGGHGVSLAIDAESALHVVYEDTTSHIAYARRRDGEWIIEQVEPGVLGTGASLVLDAEGLLRLAYAHTAAGMVSGVRYGVLRKTGWSFEAIDDTPGSGSHPGLVVLPDGRARIAYGFLPEGSLVVATQTESGWDVETVVEQGFGTGAAAIGVDGAGATHLAFRTGADGGSIQHATDASGTWQFDVVEPGGSGAFVALAASSTFVDVLFRGDGSGSMRVARTGLPIIDTCADAGP